MKKKLYNTPEVEYIEILIPPCMLEISAPTTEDDDEMGDSDDSGAGEYIGGSWENIWN